MKAPALEASIVLTAIVASRGSAADRLDPALKPNQPNASTSVPITIMGRLWPGIGLMVPSRRNLPARGPSTIVPASAVRPPVMCTTEAPAKSTWPCPRPQFTPMAPSQPPPHTQLA